MKINIVTSIDELEKCFPVIVQLRTDLSNEEFLNNVKKQKEEGYELVYVEDKMQVVAVAGFRFLKSLAYGKFLYVDDLITDSSSRSKGYGDKLFDWLIDFALKNQCKSIQLDSGVQRYDAHRFYLRKRMNIIAHHFFLSTK